MKCTYFSFCHNFPQHGNTCFRCRSRITKHIDPATPPLRQSRSEYGVLAVGASLGYSPDFLLDYLLDSPLDEKTQQFYQPHGPRGRAKAKWVKANNFKKSAQSRALAKVRDKARMKHIRGTLKEVAFG